MNTTTQATTDYNAQAKAFLTQTGVTFNCEFLKHGNHFDNDKDTRDIYKITLTRGKRSYSFNFGQSIANSGFYYTVGKRKTELDRKYLNKNYFVGKSISLIGQIKLKDHSFSPQCESDKIHYPTAPNEYDVLTCLQKYDVGTFENFCNDFGYDTDSRTAEKTYKAVCDEYKQLCAIFTDDEIEQLQEIQ